jgi:hypothetical protein
MEINHALPDHNSIDGYFKHRFSGKAIQYTLNGREAISLALQHYQLRKDDVVTILTTTGNLYISSCVTGEIEKFCSWSRKLETNTKIILVNHEFGFPYQEMSALKELGLPIIEDCAHSFFSKGGDIEMGTAGDFVIYSFPKMFPLQIGGLLVSDVPGNMKKGTELNHHILSYLKKVLSHYIDSAGEIMDQRVSHYQSLQERVESLGFSARFPWTEGVVPGVFMFSVDDPPWNLPDLKRHFYAHGIQCSVFYGEEAFFIPVHQALSEYDMDYFYEVLKSFIH